MDERYREEREAFLSEASAEMDEGRYDDAIVRADARLRNMPGDIPRESLVPGPDGKAHGGR